MSIITLPFGKLLPDQAGFRNPGVITANNVVPQVGSYGPLRELAFQSNALEGRCYGAISARDKSNNVYVYAGTTSKLYEMVGYAFADQSKVGGYSAPVDDTWEMAVWDRNGKVIATNYVDPIQSIDIGGGASGAFADMITSTNKPKAKHIGIVGQFVVLGNTNDATDGERFARVWWGGFGDETDFDPDSATQCDFEDLAKGGSVQRIVGGTEYGLIFQSDMVRTMRYVGEGAVFELLPINYAPGTPIPKSVIAHKGLVFYIAEDGVMMVNGATVTPVGSGQVDTTFWNEFDIANKNSVSAAIDPVRKLVCWAYPNSSAVAGLPNRMMMLRYDDGRFAFADIDVEILMRTETQGYTLDGLDSVGTNIDNGAVFADSFDSDRWKGGAIRFAAFDTSHKLAFFTGATRKGVITTGDIQPIDGQRWQLNAVLPLLDGGLADVSVASRNVLRDVVSYGLASGMNAEGICQLRTAGRYQRVRASLTSSTSWSHFQGLMIDFEPQEGER